MKKVILAFAVLVTAVSVNAQDNPSTSASTTSTTSTTMAKRTSFSIGVEGAVPMGKFNDEGYKFGIGGSVQVEHRVAPDFAIGLNAGYINHKNHQTAYDAHFTVIPVMAIAKYFFTPMFYAQGGLGAAFNSFKQSNVSNNNSQTSTAFAYSPGLGVMIGKNIDFMVKYFGNTFEYPNTNIKYTRSSVGGRLAVSF